jgi:hypothetical protein
MIRAPEVKKQAVMLRGFFADQGVNLTHRQALDRVAQMQGHPSWQVMEKHLRTQPVDTRSVTAVTGSYDATQQIAILWSVNDVHSVRPDLDTDQCLSVLNFVKRNHDAEQGVNWTVMSQATDQLYGVWHIEAQFCPQDSDAWETVTVNLCNGEIVCVAKEEFIAAEDHLDFVTENRNGLVRFSELRDDEFEVAEGQFGDAEELVYLCETLRAGGAIYDGRTRPERSWL